ncbi:SKP1-like protein 17 [Cicer arietinum]|uniref:SKP1-like protein n=1 Tax=Cicer arietinum TaxID=3827 RepID=A0A1S2XGM8_CICAR|nr:SKP1-like protein 17 [Cicer arietinum]
MAAAKSSIKKITLVAADDSLFEVEPNIVKEMKTVQSYMDEVDQNNVTIPLPNVFSDDLAMIIEYCKKHVSEEETKEAKEEFDVEFVKGLKSDDKFRLLQAASYLNMESLLQFFAKAIADEIENQSVEFVREYFHIENDFTPEEESEIRKQNEWAFQKESKDQK